MEARDCDQSLSTEILIKMACIEWMNQSFIVLMRIQLLELNPYNRKIYGKYLLNAMPATMLECLNAFDETRFVGRFVG